MSLYGALAENTRRNERLEHGSITVPATGVGTVRLGPGAATVNITSPMRRITNFLLELNDNGAILSGIVGASTAAVTGSLNAAGTILTIHTLSFTSATNPTLIAATTTTIVQYWLLGNLSAAAPGVPGF